MTSLYERKRRKLNVGKSIPKQKKPEPVFTWAFKSSQPRGGTIISYIAQLNQDGTLSCNCPGWIFAKKNQERACKHTKLVEDEAPEIFKKWKKGEELPIYEEDAPAPSQTMQEAHATKVDKNASKIGKYGRFIALD